MLLFDHLATTNRSRKTSACRGLYCPPILPHPGTERQRNEKALPDLRIDAVTVIRCTFTKFPFAALCGGRDAAWRHNRSIAWPSRPVLSHAGCPRRPVLANR